MPIINQNLKKDKEAEKEKVENVDSEDEQDKKSKKSKKRKAASKKLNRQLSDEEIAQLVDIPKNSGVLVVFEGWPSLSREFSAQVHTID